MYASIVSLKVSPNSFLKTSNLAEDMLDNWADKRFTRLFIAERLLSFWDTTLQPIGKLPVVEVWWCAGVLMLWLGPRISSRHWVKHTTTSLMSCGTGIMRRAWNTQSREEIAADLSSLFLAHRLVIMIPKGWRRERRGRRRREGEKGRIIHCMYIAQWKPANHCINKWVW